MDLEHTLLKLGAAALAAAFWQKAAFWAALGGGPPHRTGAGLALAAAAPASAP